MKKAGSRLKFLLIVLVIAGAALILKNLFSSVPFFKPSPLLSFEDKDIISITLTGERKTQTLLHKNNAWVLTVKGITYQADAEKMTALLETLHGLTKENVVSRNTAKRNDFGIKTSKIVLVSARRTDTVFVGSSSLGSDAYIAYDAQPEVYTGRNAGTLFLDGDYRDLHIPFGNTGDATGLEIQGRTGTAVLTKEGNAWRGKNGTPVSDIAVNAYLNNISGQEATDILPPSTEPEEKTELTVLITTGGKTISASISPIDNGNYVLKLSGSANRYVVPKVYVATLDKTEADFIAPTTQP